MKLLIAIPALNEEQSIASIIERCLQARALITQKSLVTQVAITVVSDGSTDRTVEIAQRYTDQIHLIIFKKNRGYGAAIKEAWRQSDADLLGFIDADGTCDPNFFRDLCQVLDDQNAGIALGCRMNAKSKMPALRRFGNFIFAKLLSMFSSEKVRDTASGMRVVRRTCLPELMPLPDGLHFTPAMSAHAILSRDIKIAELDMPYQEREGRSKLSPLKDGLRFLRVITESAFLYRPERLLGFLGLCALVYGTLLISKPFVFYLIHHRLEEWMIYRFVISSLTAVAGTLFICAGYLCSKIVRVTISHRSWASRRWSYLSKIFAHPFFWWIPVGLIILGGILIFPSLIYYLETGTVYEHWSRFIAMSALVSTALVLIATKLIDLSLNLIAARLNYLKAGKHKEWIR